MYLSILKKDLKRKKTMNCILLLFVILSAMFAASSINNIVAVLTGRDSYFDKAGVKDYFIISRGEKLGEDGELYSILKNSSVVTDVAREECLYVTDSNIRYPDGSKVCEYTNASDINSIDRVALNYFDKDNNVIKSIEKGKIYTNVGFFKEANLSEGDRINVEMDGTVLELEVAGSFKDAPLGSDMMGVKRFLINDDDYKTLLANEKITSNSIGYLYYADTTDIQELEKELADVDGIYFKGDKDLLKTTYFMDLAVAAMILVLSIFLVVISFVVLRFTIGFTIAEEFREIGVMKAIGIKNISIRALYLVKYFGISLIGALIGFVLSKPFGDMLISSVSSNMVLENESRTLMSFICSMAVVVIIMLFGWRCTGKIKKLSPIDAVRNGQTGERFRKRSIMSLSKSRLGTAPFLAANDILSSPRRYSIITIIFTLCMLLVMILSTTSNSMNSAEMVTLLSVKPSDAYVAYSSAQFDILNGRKTEQEAEDEIIQKLKENGMIGDVRIELMALINASLGDRQKKITFQYCSKTNASDYEYTEGSAPQNRYEIALTEPAAKSIGAKIGDKVTLDIGGQREEYLVTALYDSFTQGGECGRLHQDVEIPSQQYAGAYSFQIDFDDDPDEEELNRRIDKLADIFECKAFDSVGFLNDCTGVADTLKDVKNLILIISVIVIIMISVLMERSFISKETGEIALQKAIGIPSWTIILTHTLRFIIVSILSAILAAALSIPFTRISMTPIYQGVFGIKNVPYVMNIAEIFIIIPLAVILATVAGAFFTALYTKTIKAQDTANIE